MKSISEYQEEYNSLIEKAKNRILEEYTEVHHIIPECIGGPDTTENKVLLTPEEHFDAHQLLALIYPDNQGLYVAAIMMSGKNTITREEFGEIKRRFSEIQSKRMSGEGNPMFGRRHSEETISLHFLGENNPMFGHKHTEEFKKQASIRNSGEGNPNYGKYGKDNPNFGNPSNYKHSDEIIENLKGPKEKFACLYCGGFYAPSNLAQFHNENCRENPNFDPTTRKTLICPHCETETSPVNAKRYHFDNCLENPNFDITCRPKKICPHCSKEVDPANAKRHHFDNCRHRPKD